MYEPIPGGSSLEIQGITVQLPPVGYVKNVLTGQVEYRGVHSRSPSKEDQYWEREALPTNWRRKSASEQAKQVHDPDYVDPELEALRSRWWDRRLNGMWFMNNGKATYLPGGYWYYLNCWRIDIGYPDFRIPDLNKTYFIAHNDNDPLCYGTTELTKRRFGKTYYGGCWVTEGTTRKSDALGGIQSKTSKDAKDTVYMKAVVTPFTMLPDFFIPEYDTSKGKRPKSSIDLFLTRKRGRGSNDVQVNEEQELRSIIDWRSSEKLAYDGTKLWRYLRDEVGKTKAKEADVWEGWQVIKMCIETDGVVTGKALLPTTVEDLEDGGENYKKIWDASDQNNRMEATGKTKSGLYRYFTPAYETLYFDKYGFPDVERAKAYYMAEREALEDDHVALSAYIRKNPFTAEEAFRIDGDGCLYNAIKLNDRRDFLSWQKEEHLYERGNLRWKDNIKDGEVEWIKSKKGRWLLRWNFPDDPKDFPVPKNGIRKFGSTPTPMNRQFFAMAVDPYDHDRTVDGRRSDGSCHVKFKHSSVIPEELQNMFVMEYCNRPPKADMFYEDMILTCVYFGVPMLFEDQKQGIKKYFEWRGYGNFLLKLPGRQDPGIPGNDKSHKEIAEFTEQYIEDHIDKVWFPKLLVDWLKFKIEDTTKFDRAMSSGYTLIADMAIMYNQPPKNKELVDVNKIFKPKKVPTNGALPRRFKTQNQRVVLGVQ